MQQNGNPETADKAREQSAPATDKDALSNPELFEAYEDSMGDLSDADNAASAGGPAV